MVFPKARLVVSAGLFLAWIGFLAFLVTRTRNPVIISRPQLNVAEIVVLADVEEKDGRPAPNIKVQKVIRARAEGAGLTGTQLSVPGLMDCGSTHGWDGPGTYIVLLSKRNEMYEVTPIPPSPAYPRPRPDVPPKYVTIELVKGGTDKEHVTKLVSEFLGSQAKNYEGIEGILRRNVPWIEAEKFKKQMEDAHAKVMIREEESRIYHATPDALEQLMETGGREKGR